MRDYMTASCGYGQFQHHVVIGVGQERPPQEMDFLQMGLTGKIADEAQGVLRRAARLQVFRAAQHVLPLRIKSHRKAGLEFRRGNRTHQREARAPSRPRGRYQHVRVQHYSRRASWSHAFPCVFALVYSLGKAPTMRTVSRLTRTTWPTNLTMYSSSSARLGSERTPLRWSSLTWYWSMTHSRALRLPRRY